MYRLRTFGFVLILVTTLSFGAWYAPRALNPVPPSKEKLHRDNAWVSSSPYWLDRQACRWMSLCGIHHLRPDPPFIKIKDPGPLAGDEEGSDRRLELRSLESLQSMPVLDDSAREAAWELVPPPVPPPRTQKTFGKSKAHAKGKTHAKSKPGPRQPIPKFVLDYAPLVHLCSKEYFWPADIAEHVQHVSPHREDPVTDDTTPVNITEKLSLNNIHELLNGPSSSIYLVSDNDVEHRPEWLYSNIGVPVPSDDDDYDDEDGTNDSPARDAPWEDEARDDAQRLTPPTSWFDADRGRPIHRISDPRRLERQPDHRQNRGPRRKRGAHDHLRARVNKPDESGYSKAPAVLILVDKGSGILDAFWFFFYSYNLGQTVLGIRFGNHVGDWEHAMVRFEHGVPRGIFFSEHEGGQAYSWEAVEKVGGRPVIYSAVGSHAMYAMPGLHPYILPFKLLKDVTDHGPIWDPAKNIYAYHYDHDLDDDLEDPKKGENAGALVAAEENPTAPIGWFYFDGTWGDKTYSLADPRQWRLFGQYHYVTGPSGPRVKNLGRKKMCQNDHCTILNSLVPGTTWYG
ncbi:related to VPS62 - Vacuolar Protein Sorting [Cephalotrichum gorgonifer]|uniref:Related to VPS62 - Vacuolar Protein Sorting n=1 Tax=Cephalotrichum gorgonifer TaxID=2041049 RepID=A0AAE8MPG4_9PEZI|nr:related to VPS62 - Vacuolar Protein Sorting [Cephalotrichum gorgonifer]